MAFTLTLFHFSSSKIICLLNLSYIYITIRIVNTNYIAKVKLKNLDKFRKTIGCPVICK